MSEKQIDKNKRKRTSKKDEKQKRVEKVRTSFTLHRQFNIYHLNITNVEYHPYLK